jgi:hypothetical protein
MKRFGLFFLILAAVVLRNLTCPPVAKADCYDFCAAACGGQNNSSACMASCFNYCGHQRSYPS